MKVHLATKKHSGRRKEEEKTMKEEGKNGDQDQRVEQRRVQLLFRWNN
jgi:hypothetical protein